MIGKERSLKRRENRNLKENIWSVRGVEINSFSSFESLTLSDREVYIEILSVKT